MWVFLGDPQFIEWTGRLRFFIQYMCEGFAYSMVLISPVDPNFLAVVVGMLRPLDFFFWLSNHIHLVVEHLFILIFCMDRQTGNMYKNSKKKIERGVAFPTCISVNNIFCHFSPLASDESVLEENDIVKMWEAYFIMMKCMHMYILVFVCYWGKHFERLFFFLMCCSDMGCHIDGFIAVVAHTHVLQEGPVSGRAADVIAAANTAAEVALRLVRPGRKVKYMMLYGPFLLSWLLVSPLHEICLCMTCPTSA